MQKLDLSLDIPDAPYILCVKGSHGVDPHQEAVSVRAQIASQQITAGWGAGSHTLGSQRAVRQPAPLRGQPNMVGNQICPDEMVSLMAEDLQIRQKLRHSWQNLDQSQTLVVRPAATLSGDVVCHSLRLQGELRGSLMANGVVHVEREALFNGVIRQAEMVIVEGTVVGPANALAIRCDGLVVLGESARVVGHIQCRSVAIYQGASVVGTIQALA